MFLKKYWITITFCIFIGGCSAPGTYMGSSDVRTAVSASNLEGKLMRATIIPIDTNLLFSKDKEISKPKDMYLYRIGPNDVLNVIVWNHPELSMTSGGNESSSFFAPDLKDQSQSLTQATPQPMAINVEADGYIFFPLVGRFKVEGMTIEQIRNTLTAKLMRYIRNPQVSVGVGKYNSKLVNIMGEVVQPGIRPLTNRPISILDGLNLVGGIRPDSGDRGKYLFD